jgi:hypothetical protein
MPFDREYYDEHDLQETGFKSHRNNVRAGKNCTTDGAQKGSIACPVCIDCHTRSSLLVRVG